MRLAVACAIVGCLLTGALSATAADLSREALLIQKLGRADADRLSKPPQPPTKAELIAASRTIDEYLQTSYRTKKIAPNPHASEDIWLRRVYLDIIGRIPTLEETVRFRNSNTPDKRSKLIDELLDSDGYAINSFNYWADLLRIQTNMPGGVAYAGWLKNSLKENKPYDKMVTDMLTAKGFPWENGATGYFIRDDGMPLDNMALTTQVFLGTSLVCAQCHDHPFDKWKQRDFYQMAAYTYGIQTRMEPENVKAAKQLARKESESVRGELDNLTRVLTYGVHETKRQLNFPHDYKYSDAKPNDPVYPAVIFGRAETDGDQSPREAYAHWIVDRQNPRFTQVIANRLWKRVFGAGLIEPVDQMTDRSKPSHPELMSFLTYKMASFNYDVKLYLKMLYNTDLYLRAVTVQDAPEGQPSTFAGPVLKRMTAEQFWDSLMTLVIPDPDHRTGAVDEYAYLGTTEALREATPQSLVAMAVERSEYNQARRAINEELRTARDKKDTAAIERLEAKMRDLKQPSMGPSMMKSDKMMAGDDKAMAAKAAAYGKPATAGKSGTPAMLARRVDPAIWKDYPAEFVRASEMNSPANFSHFLRQFGQSDRELINNANENANLIQVLAMFNGPMFKHVMSEKSQVMQNVASVGTPADKVQIIFLSLLNREPTAYERQTMSSMLSSTKPEYGKLIWAILNTREFSFIQ